MFSISHQLRVFAAVSLSICFLGHSLWLFLNTDTTSFDFLEFGKFVGIPATVMILAQLPSQTFSQIVRFSILMVVALLAIGFIGAGLGFWGILDETRLFIPILGRGAGETAWALCVLYVFLDFLQVATPPPSNLREVIIRIFILILIFLTASRAAILFMGVYFILRYRNMLLKTMVVGLPLLLALSYSAFSGNDSISMVARTMSADRILTGREYIWSAHVDDFLQQPLDRMLIGHDFAPKIVDVPEVGYITADVHNLFFDFVRVYGIVGLMYFLGYLTLAKYSISEEYGKIIWSGLLALFVMSLFVSVFRYPYLPLLTAVFLALPFFRKPTIRYANEFQKYDQAGMRVCAGVKNKP